MQHCSLAVDSECLFKQKWLFMTPGNVKFSLNPFMLLGN